MYSDSCISLRKYWLSPFVRFFFWVLMQIGANIELFPERNSQAQYRPEMFSGILGWGVEPNRGGSETPEGWERGGVGVFWAGLLNFCNTTYFRGDPLKPLDAINLNLPPPSPLTLWNGGVLLYEGSREHLRNPFILIFVSNGTDVPDCLIWRFQEAQLAREVEDQPRGSKRTIFYLHQSLPSPWRLPT